MSEPSEDVVVKVATTLAQDFVQTYYSALNNSRDYKSLVNLYVKPTPTSPTKSDISMNGNVLLDPAELVRLFENQVSKAHYEVQDYDCHTLNTNYNIGVEEGALGPDKDGKKMSVMVMVSGSVKFWKEGEAVGEPRGFTDIVVLVPNREGHGPKATKGERKWLILSQNFRLVL